MSIGKFITRKAFPIGDFENIKTNAPDQMSYNIDATRDLVKNQPFNPYAPALAMTMSLPYDTIQGIQRAFKGFEPQTGIMDYDDIPDGPTFADIGRSIAAENPIDSLIGRTYGATLGLGDKLTDYAQGLKGLFDSSAIADEPMSIEDFQVQNIKDRPIASIPSNFLNYRFQNARTPFTPVREGITTLRNQIGNLKDKGIDVGRMALSGIGRLAAGPIGGILGSLIGSVKESPEQRAMKDFYKQNFGLTDTGQVASGVMQGYNPVSLFGGVGLNQAIDKRIAKINQTLAKQKENRSKVLENRLKELKELRAKESAAASAALEAQRRGRRPGTGGDGPGVKDSGGIGGGYSYDSGGREGFGYGL